MEKDFAHQAKVLIVERKYREAIRLCREGLVMHPDHLEGQVVLDMALVALQRFLDVCAELGPVVERDASNIRARRMLAEALLSLGDRVRSEKLFEEVQVLESPEQLFNEFLEKEPSLPAREKAYPSRPSHREEEAPLPLEEDEDRAARGRDFSPLPLETEDEDRSPAPDNYTPSPIPYAEDDDESPAPDNYTPSPLPFDEIDDESLASAPHTPSPIPIDELEGEAHLTRSSSSSPIPLDVGEEKPRPPEVFTPLPNAVAEDLEESPPPNSIPPPASPLPLGGFDSPLPGDDEDANDAGDTSAIEGLPLPEIGGDPDGDATPSEKPATPPPLASQEGVEAESSKGKPTSQTPRTAIPPPFTPPEAGERYESVWEESLELPPGFGDRESDRFDVEPVSGGHFFEVPEDLPAELPDEFGEHLKEKGSWHRFETPPQDAPGESAYPPLPDGLEIEISMVSEDHESFHDLLEAELPELFDELGSDEEAEPRDEGLHPFPTWEPKQRPPIEKAADSRSESSKSPTPPVAPSVAQTRRSRRRHSSLEVQQKANRLLEFGYLYQRLASGGHAEITKVEADLRRIAEEFPGTPRERQKLKLVSTWWRSLTHVMARGTSLWPPHRILLQLATEHAARSPLSLSAESWVSSNLQEMLWIRARSRPPRPLAPSCLAAVEVGGSILNLVASDDGKAAVVLVGHYDLFKNEEDWQRIIKVDLENLSAEPVGTAPTSDTDISDLHTLLDGQPARMVQNKKVSLPDMELQKTYAELVLENVGVHNEELGTSPEPVAMLKDGRRIVSGTHDGILRVWDVEVLADAAQQPSDDTWARQTIDRLKHYIKNEHKDGWLGWSSKRLATSITREREPWDTPDPLWRQNIDVWEFMNWGFENIAFRIASPYQISLYQRSPRRHLAAWIAPVPLVRIGQEEAILAPDIWVCRRDDLLAVETQCGTAIALQLVRGEAGIDPRELDTRQADETEPPPWL